MFEGFTSETFEFFMALRFNNNTDFFHANHDWYTDSVRKPALALAEALAPTMERIDPEIERRPGRVLARVNRDIRFSRDKSPYRDYIWLAFRRPEDKRHDGLAFYFDMSDSGGSCGMGYYRENRDMMQLLRHRCETEPGYILDLLAPLAKDFQIEWGPKRRLKVPENVPESLHRMYLTNGFHFVSPFEDARIFRSSALADEIIRRFELLTPIYTYFRSMMPDPIPEIGDRIGE